MIALKEVKAVFQASMLNEVLMALHKVPSMPGFTTSEVSASVRAHKGFPVRQHFG